MGKKNGSRWAEVGKQKWDSRLQEKSEMKSWDRKKGNENPLPADMKTECPNAGALGMPSPSFGQGRSLAISSLPLRLLCLLETPSPLKFCIAHPPHLPWSLQRLMPELKFLWPQVVKGHRQGGIWGILRPGKPTHSRTQLLTLRGNHSPWLFLHFVVRENGIWSQNLPVCQGTWPLQALLTWTTRFYLPPWE